MSRLLITGTLTRRVGEGGGGRRNDAMRSSRVADALRSIRCYVLAGAVSRTMNALEHALGGPSVAPRLEGIRRPAALGLIVRKVNGGPGSGDRMSDLVHVQILVQAQVQSPKSKVQGAKIKIPKSKVHRAKVQSPRCKVTSPRCKVQSPGCKVQSPTSKVHCATYSTRSRCTLLVGLEACDQ